MTTRNDVRAAIVAAAVAIPIITLIGLGSADSAATEVDPFTSATVSPAANGDVLGAPVPTTTAPSTAQSTVAPPRTDLLPDLDGNDLTTARGCVLAVQSVRVGSSGESVSCVQNALVSAGYYEGPITGAFDTATAAAVERLQSDRKLFVDGVVGRETALSLAIWPDEESLVIRTPKPPPGAVDLMGYPLSSVATSGPDAPAVPQSSGSGRRLVYERAGQRVWAIDEQDRVVRSWLVSGSKYSNEVPGTHKVYSKSEMSTAWNGQAWLPKMVRWLKTDIGAIGFHAIPLYVDDNSPYMTESELGTRLSGGCQRQANADADFLWDFAEIGTTVVVI
jgi:peptidoglycan hydrolase-like protein with peptidoglycan-binding domain